jgi:predicted O-methyltransferase YrrM
MPALSDDLVRKRAWGSVRLVIEDDAFLSTKDSGRLRSWLLHRLLTETVADLEALHAARDQFVTGSERPLISDSRWSSAEAEFTADELTIAGQQVMQAWETQLMSAMVNIAARQHGHVLEVGFGMGISAEYFQVHGVSSHTIIELNDDVFERAERWRATRPDADIRLIRGRWQDTIDRSGEFDAVFYDAYPVSDLEVAKLVQVPFPVTFFEAARRVLRPGGVLTYYTNEIDSLSRWHQRALLKSFQRFNVAVVDGLRPPEDCHYWWAPSMVVVGAYA